MSQDRHYRELQRFYTIEEGPENEDQPFDDPPSGAGVAPRGTADASAVSAFAMVLVSCGLFVGDLTTDVLAALPRLWMGGAHLEFWMQLLAVMGCGAIGAAVSTTEIGVWGKVERVPRWLRMLFVAGMCGAFLVVPFAIFGLIIAAWNNNEPRFVQTCVQARMWLDGGGLLQVFISLVLQASAVAMYGLDLWLSIAFGFALMVKVAAEHDTQQQVYLRLQYREGSAGMGRDLRESTWEESAPLVTGPLKSLLHPHAVPVIIFRAAEVATSVGILAIWHAGTRDWLQAGETSIGGPVLLMVQFVTHFVIFRVSAPWMSLGATGVLRALTAACFCPKPLLDADGPVAMHYAVAGAVQLFVFAAGSLVLQPTELPVAAQTAVFLSALAMWPLLLVLRLVLAAPTAEPEGARELAEKVKAGVVQLQPLPFDYLMLPQMVNFSAAFCESYFSSSFAVQDGIVKLDLSGTDTDVTCACTALFLAEPLTADAHGFELNLEGTTVSDEDIADMVKHFPPTLLSLEVNLAGTKVGDDGVFALAQSLPVHMTSFEAGLNSTVVGDEGLAALAQHLPRDLLSLEAVFYNTQVSDAGVVTLAKHLPRSLTNFRAGFYRTKVGDEGVAALADNLPDSLTTFKADLAGTQVTDAGAVALAEKLPELARLEKFDANLAGTRVSEDVKQMLKQATKASSSTPTFQGRQRIVVEDPTEEQPRGYCCSLLPFPFCTREAALANTV